MRVNPDDYDPEELRTIARNRRSRPSRRPEPTGRATERGSDRRGPNDGGSFTFDIAVEDENRRPAADVFRANQLEQLFFHQSSIGDDLEKPFVRSVPNEYAAERVVFDWLEFLLLKGGFKRAMDALDYYRTIGWLSPRAAAELREYLVGFSADVDDTHDLDLEDHHLSLVYVAKLASMAGDS